MTDFYDEINVLVNNISTGRINTKEVKHQVDRLKEKYGTNVFPSFDFQKKHKSWDMEYLYELQKKNVTGACSEEFILHMAEVSDYVFDKKKIKATGAIAVAIIIVILMIIMALLFNKSKQNDEQSLDVINNILEEVDGSDAVVDDSALKQVLEGDDIYGYLISSKE